jgi:ribosomal protein L29
MKMSNENGGNVGNYSNTEINFIMQQLSHISNSINKQYSEINSEMQFLRREMAELNAKFAAKDSMINNIDDWKKDVSQIVTLSDLNEMKNQKLQISNMQNKIDQQSSELVSLQTQHINDENKNSHKFKEVDEQLKDLNDFKIKAFTIFSVVQIIMTVALFWKEMFGK